MPESHPHHFRVAEYIQCESEKKQPDYSNLTSLL